MFDGMVDGMVNGTVDGMVDGMVWWRACSMACCDGMSGWYGGMAYIGMVWLNGIDRHTLDSAQSCCYLCVTQRAKRAHETKPKPDRRRFVLSSKQSQAVSLKKNARLHQALPRFDCQSGLFFGTHIVATGPSFGTAVCETKTQCCATPFVLEVHGLEVGSVGLPSLKGSAL